MKFIQTSRKQWYIKHNNLFYCIVKNGYVYEAFVITTDAKRIENTTKWFQTKKEAEQYLKGLMV